MGNGFYDNPHATEQAQESAAADAGRAKVELEDIHEKMTELTAIGRELLIHLREMTGIDAGEDCQL